MKICLLWILLLSLVEGTAVWDQKKTWWNIQSGIGQKGQGKNNDHI